jgi:hypothetical protein
VCLVVILTGVMAGIHLVVQHSEGRAVLVLRLILPVGHNLPEVLPDHTLLGTAVLVPKVFIYDELSVPLHRIFFLRLRRRW